MENRIVDYIVVQDISPEALQTKVKELITEKSLQPFGGISVSFAPNQRPVFIQAMVVYAK